MDAGFLKEDCGMVVVNSSSNFVRRENAGRTGYSWSVMMMAEEGSQPDNSTWNLGPCLTCELLCTTPVVHMGGVVVLLYTLSLALRSSLCDRLGEES